MGKKVKLADYIAAFITKLGVRDVFMVTGGGSMHLNESIGSNPKLRYLCNLHEQASAMAAEGYARLKGLGVCIVTTGPGGTNTITGVAGAWQDSIPTLYISGQVKRETMVPKRSPLRQLGVQEINIVEIVKSITKYAVVVDRPEEIKHHLEKAVYLATTGRPGPVWLDVPLDVQASYIDVDNLPGFNRQIQQPLFNKSLLSKQIFQTLDLLQKAERPVILAGGGIRLAKAQKTFLNLVKKAGIPVLTAMSANDLIASDNKLFFGRPGAFGGNRPGNFILQNTDLLISIGARLHLWTIGFDYKNLARGAKKIIVDIDEAELRKPTIKPDIAVQADVKVFIEEFQRQSKAMQFPSWEKWLTYCRKVKQQYPVVLPEYKNQKRFVNYYYFVDVLSDVLRKGEIVVTAVGTSFSATAQAMKIKPEQRLIYNVGCASMGYGLPAAIGVCLANNKKRTICLEGDGSIQMNIQELQTVVHYKLPLKIFVINNDGYLSIRTTQDAYFNSHYVGSNPKTGVSSPDFGKVAKAFGIPFLRIKNHKGLRRKIKRVLDLKGPVLCEIMMDPKQLLIPKSTSMVKPNGQVIAKPLEDMYPFLPRDEFYSNMLIKPIDED